jgi:hypothetical protein
MTSNVTVGRESVRLICSVDASVMPQKAALGAPHGEIA